MQVDLSVWTQLNPNVWQRVYADGTVGIVRASENKSAEWWADYFDVDGAFEDAELEDVAGTLDEMKAALDKRFDPQPEEHRFDTITVLKLGGKENAAYQWSAKGGGDFWNVLHGYVPSGRCCRNVAEAAARDWLKQQVLTSD